MLRLRSATDFERVRRDGRSHAHPLVVLLICQRTLVSVVGGAVSTVARVQVKPSRFGFAAGKSVGTAVKRNRAKRLLREAVRAYLPEIAPGWDLVFIARRPLAAGSLRQAREAVSGLLQRAGVLKKTHA